MLINSIDRDALRERVRGSKPVPNFCIDGFLEPGFARRVADSYPSYEDAVKVGKEFAAVNEQKKVQVTDPAHFPGPVAELNDALAAPEFTALLSYVFDIPNLLPDAKLEGGGIHQTGPAMLLLCVATLLIVSFMVPSRAPRGDSRRARQ